MEEYQRRGLAVAEQAGLEPTPPMNKWNGLAIRSSTDYAYCSMCCDRQGFAPCMRFQHRAKPLWQVPIFTAINRATGARIFCLSFNAGLIGGRLIEPFYSPFNIAFVPSPGYRTYSPFSIPSSSVYLFHHYRIWRKMEDSNPQEIVTYLHVGFLDRCVTITLIFRMRAPHR